MEQAIYSVKFILKNEKSYLIPPDYLPIVEQCKNCKQFQKVPLDKNICNLCNHKSNHKKESYKTILFKNLHNWLYIVGYNFKSGSFLCLELLDNMLGRAKEFEI